ncbi:RICIN domain-containing protein [Streptomyces sp. NBC_00557]|uniref:RICIN domain-containing protein n=1 Tax=Streptomyces sp. NBC_00557 TaxID=2975776 RepID=UPI002E815C3F|nr:RICIN domain-containing protein [Streptomyces sp. NBC_00557]WUC32745.1 RICIN domain-containing protein [Streptomyces sp. NBC_00557]
MRKFAAVLSGLAAGVSLTLVSSGTASATPDDGILANTAGVVTLCATPQGNSTANGTIVTTWSCTGSSLQRWSYDGTYIKNIASGKCLTPSGNHSGTNGTVLTLWTCTNDTSQRFVIDYSNNHTVIFTQFGGKCITNQGDSMGYGVYLTLWTCNFSYPESQEWNVI